MTGPDMVETNVFVYRHDESDPATKTGKEKDGDRNVPAPNSDQR